jgi:hypothetical protein
MEKNINYCEKTLKNALIGKESVPICLRELPPIRPITDSDRSDEEKKKIY